ncbi:MAG: hypothetical protein FWE77_05775 [Clostridia bacterium]|nr:hypothetical protein [Clostridia bacterium]
MRIRRVFILLPAMLLALVALWPPTAASAGSHQITERLREGMPPFVFTLEYFREQHGHAQAEAGLYDDEGVFFYIHSIVITREDTGGEVQRINLNPPAETFADEEYGFGLVLEDMNFDGFMDMRVMQFVSAGANIPYHCWLWDPAAQRFEYSEALSAIPSPLFDPDRRQVLGFGTGGPAEYIYTAYEFRGAELVLVGRVTTGYDYEGGTSIVTTEELIDGQMVVTGVTKEPLLQPEEGDFDW